MARRALVPLLLLAIWQYASTAGFFDPSFVPSPISVVTSWWQWIFGPRSELAWYSGTWLTYVYLSGWRVLVGFAIASARSEEHTSELQSLTNLVCRLLLEKKKKLCDNTSSMNLVTAPNH